MNKPCEICGTMLENVYKHTKYCDKCRKEQRDRQNYESHKRIAEAKRAVEPTVKRCALCDCEILLDLTRTGRRRKYCPTCSIAAARGHVLKAKKPPQKKRKKPMRHCWDLDYKSRVQVDVEARALGLTYGKYSALIDSLMIERYLSDIGITDGLARIDAAWTDFKRRKREREEADKLRLAQAKGEI